MTADLAPCGTPRGYRQHLHRGETPCEPCRAANATQAKSYRAEAEQRRRERNLCRGAYGVLKRHQILAALPVEEQDEVERLEARKHRSAASDERLTELWHRAHQLHQAEQQCRAEEPPDTWFEELKERMWGRLAT